MIKISEMFLSKLNKLKDYWILRAENEEIIIGTNIVVNVHIEKVQTFSTYSQNVKTLFPVYFLLTKLDKSDGIKKEFEKRNLPIRKLDKNLLNSSVNNIKIILDEFVKGNFSLD